MFFFFGRGKAPIINPQKKDNEERKTTSNSHFTNTNTNTSVSLMFDALIRVGPGFWGGGGWGGCVGKGWDFCKWQKRIPPKLFKLIVVPLSLNSSVK